MASETKATAEVFSEIPPRPLDECYSCMDLLSEHVYAHGHQHPIHWACLSPFIEKHPMDMRCPVCSVPIAHIEKPDHTSLVESHTVISFFTPHGSRLIDAVERDDLIATQANLRGAWQKNRDIAFSRALALNRFDMMHILLQMPISPELRDSTIAQLTSAGVLSNAALRIISELMHNHDNGPNPVPVSPDVLNRAVLNCIDYWTESSLASIQALIPNREAISDQAREDAILSAARLPSLRSEPIMRYLLAVGPISSAKWRDTLDIAARHPGDPANIVHLLLLPHVIIDDPHSIELVHEAIVTAAGQDNINVIREFLHGRPSFNVYPAVIAALRRNGPHSTEIISELLHKADPDVASEEVLAALAEGDRLDTIQTFPHLANSGEAIYRGIEADIGHNGINRLEIVKELLRNRQELLSPERRRDLLEAARQRGSEDIMALLSPPAILSRIGKKMMHHPRVVCSCLGILAFGSAMLCKYY